MKQTLRFIEIRKISGMLGRVLERRFVADSIIIGLFGFICAWMWFSPIIWDLAPGSRGFIEAISAIFFENDPHEKFIGTSVDLQGTIWIFHNVDLMLKGELGTQLPDVYYPIGFDLGKNTGFGWADAVMAWPLLKLIGVPGFYNAHVFVTLWTGYMGAAALFRCAGAKLPLAMALAVLAMTHPFARQELFQGRPTQIHWLFHCFVLIAMIQMLKKRVSLKWGIFGGISLTLSCLVYWFGGVAVGFSAIFAGLIGLGIQKGRFMRSLAFGMMILTTFVITLPITWRISSMVLNGDGGNIYEAIAQDNSNTLPLSFWSIPAQKGVVIASLSDAKEVLFRSMLPVGVLVLAAIGCLYPFAWKKRLPWLVAFVIAVFLPLGAAFQWNGVWYVTPQEWLDEIFPPLARCGFPHRMVVAPILIGLVLFAISAKDCLDRIKIPWLKTIALWGVSFGILLMGAKEFPEQMTSPTSHLSPDFNLIKATQRTPGAIIHIPLTRGPENEHIQQMFHKQPILNGPGMDMVRPDGHKEYCDDNSVIQALDTMSRSYSGELPGFWKEDLEKLWEDGFRLVYIETARTRRNKGAGREEFEELLGVGDYQSGTGQLAIPLPQPKKMD